MSSKRRLGRFDDRPGSALSLWHLWQRVPSAEELDGDDERFTNEMWTYYVHQIAKESDHPYGIPDLNSPLGPVADEDRNDGPRT
jgi:hypothetical protein